MILVSTLYDEYVDRPKLTDQKKPIWVYSSSPPQEGLEQKVITRLSTVIITINKYRT